MKKLLLVLACVVMLFASCENEDDRACPVVSSESVPQAVQSAQTSHYPNATVEHWYNTDNKGYCAQFILSGTKTFAYYDNQGNFLRDDNNGENENNEEECECGDDD